MKLRGKELEERSDREYIDKTAGLIEMNLEAFGFTIRVVEVNILDGFYEFFLEVAAGTDLNKLEILDRELALALSSPNGKVYWQIPVPGTYYVGLRVPRTTSNLQHHEVMHLNRKDWRSTLARVFYLIGEANYSLARRILGIG